jgi:hypothetical protein
MTNLKDDDDDLNFLSHDYPMGTFNEKIANIIIEISKITYYALPNRMCPSKIHTFLPCRHNP